jgi:nucleoside-diphosphate-sugar epimerase
MISALVAIKRLLNDDLRLIALTREPEKFLQKYKNSTLATHIEYIRGDVKCFELSDAINVTHLVHMATTSAEETFMGEDQLKKIDLLYNGTRNALEQCGQTLENVLFTSSGVAYGVNDHPLMAEDDYTGPDTTDTSSALGVGKLTAELIIAYFSSKYKYSYSVARCFAFAGQHLPLNIHYAFGNFINNALEGKDIIIRGDGQDVRSYLYIGDAIAWLLRLLIEPKNQIFNVGSRQSVSIESLARSIVAQSDTPISVIIKGFHSGEGNFRRVNYVPSVDKILTFYPELAEWTSLKEIISKMLLLDLVQNEPFVTG